MFPPKKCFDISTLPLIGWFRCYYSMLFYAILWYSMVFYDILRIRKVYMCSDFS